MPWSRRQFLRTAALSAAAALSPPSLERVLAAIPTGPRLRAEGYGPLVPDPAGLLDLPAGFHYRALSTGVLAADQSDDARFVSTLSNGDPVPPQHDGMAAFAGPRGISVLVRNHEMNLEDAPPVDPARRRPYDSKTWGGTTTLWVDRDRQVVRAFASLSGTLRNCAGGRTPWGSWVSCEEAVDVPGAPDPVNHDATSKVSQRHGYVFEVDSRSEDLVDPAPIRAMGRFRHEALAVDPATGFVYLSEDRFDGLLYRYRPHVVSKKSVSPRSLRAGDLAKGGVLEALRVVGRPSLLTQNAKPPAGIRLGESLAVDWVPIPNVDPDMDEDRDPADPEPDPLKKRARTAATSLRAQGFALGCAQFARTEGIAYGSGSAYFCCTNGGSAQLGQVFRLDLVHQRLSLVVQPEDPTLLDGPDNLCPAPWGDLVVCEDTLARPEHVVAAPFPKTRPSRDNFLVGVTARGACYPIARNAHPRWREFAGSTFSPDGHTLFVNVQEPGITYAIWGPWEKRRG